MLVSARQSQLWVRAQLGSHVRQANVVTWFFFSGNTRFRTTLQLTRLQMSEIILTGRKTSIKKPHARPRVVRIGRTPPPLAQSVENQPIDVTPVCRRWRRVRRKRGSWNLRDTGCLRTPLLPRIRCTRVTVKV